jgi:hypothetical protein
MNTAHLVDTDEGPQGYGGFKAGNDLTDNETEDRTDNLTVFGPNATPWLDEDFDEPLPKKLILSEQLKQFSDRNHPNYQVCMLIAMTFKEVIDQKRKNKAYSCVYEKDIARLLFWLNSYRVLYLETSVLKTFCQLLQNIGSGTHLDITGSSAWTFAIATWDEPQYIEAHQPARKHAFSGPRMSNGRQVVSYIPPPEQRGGAPGRAKANYGVITRRSTRNRHQMVWVKPPGLQKFRLEMQTYEFETALLLATSDRPLREEEEKYLNEFRTGKLSVMKLLVCRTNLFTMLLFRCRVWILSAPPLPK